MSQTITRQTVAGKLAAYIRHDLSLADLVTWAEANPDSEFEICDSLGANRLWRRPIPISARVSLVRVARGLPSSASEPPLAPSHEMAWLRARTALFLRATELFNLGVQSIHSIHSFHPPSRKKATISRDAPELLIAFAQGSDYTDGP